MPAAAPKRKAVDDGQTAKKKPAAPRAVVSAAPAKQRTLANAQALATATKIPGSLAAGDEVIFKHFHVFAQSQTTTEEEAQEPAGYESDGDGGNICAQPSSHVLSSRLLLTACCLHADEDSYDRFAGLKSHSGSFAGFLTDKLTSEQLGRDVKPNSRSCCPMPDCKGKRFGGDSAFMKLGVDDLIKECLDLDYADGLVSERDMECWGCCTKGHVWGHGGVSVTMCGHLGWRIGDDY